MPRRAAIQPVQSQETPVIGHNSQATDDQLIAERHQLDDQLSAGAKKLADWAEPLKTRLEAIKSELFGRLNDRGADSTRTDSGTAYISTIMNTKVEDATALFDFLAEHWDDYGSDIQINITKEAVKRHMEQNDGQVPPGMSISHFQRLNITRS